MFGYRRTMLLSAVTAGALCFASGAQSAPRRCNCPPDTAIQVNVAPTEHVLLGSFARPDAGRDFITINPNGTRDIPANLNINDPSKEVFQAARVTVTGGSECRIRVRLGNRSSNAISRLRIAPGAGYSLSSNRSGARGVLDVTGNFEFTEGVRARVRSNDPLSFSETFDVTVEYQ